MVAAQRVEVLVNGAKIIDGGAIANISCKNVCRHLEVNVIGPVAQMQGIARQLGKRGAKGPHDWFTGRRGDEIRGTAVPDVYVSDRVALSICSATP